MNKCKGRKKTMNILVVGDVYAQVGRAMLENNLKTLKEEYKIDFIIVNGENTTHGKSINEEHYNLLKNYGVNVITSGNHIWANNNVIKYIEKTEDLLRPLNYGHHQPGQGTIVVKCKNKKIRVTNLIGRAFMGKCDNPYSYLEEIVRNDHKNNIDIHLVDFHAEATAEKIALAWEFDGKITALWGTHTHVQTNDARILPNKTAFISDIGMTGPYYSIIGANPEEVIHQEKTGLPAKFRPASGSGQFNGAIFMIDNKTNKVNNIITININPEKQLRLKLKTDD